MKLTKSQIKKLIREELYEAKYGATPLAQGDRVRYSALSLSREENKARGEVIKAEWCPEHGDYMVTVQWDGEKGTEDIPAGKLAYTRERSVSEGKRYDEMTEKELLQIMKNPSHWKVYYHAKEQLKKNGYSGEFPDLRNHPAQGQA